MKGGTHSGASVPASIFVTLCALPNRLTTGMRRVLRAGVIGEERNVLILTRRVSESIRIGEDIVLTICAVSGNAVRIGVTAPKQVSVHREEVYRRIEEETADAQLRLP